MSSSRDASSGSSAGGSGGTAGTEAAAGEPSSDDETLADDDGLLFRWKDRRGRGWAALLFFLLVAVILHVVGFYLFQVKPPLSSRVAAEPARVTMLDPKDPTVASLLREVDDRLVFLRPASQVTSNLMRIENFAVTFEPSFMQRRVDFAPPQVPERKADPLPLVDQRTGLVLPPLSRPVGAGGDREGEGEGDDGNDATEPPGSGVGWRIEGDLGGRALADGVAARIEGELEAGRLPASGAWAITANADGSVREASPLSSSAANEEESAAVTELLRAELRFVEEAAGGSASGVFRIRP